MADQKLTQLDAITVATVDDLLYLVDAPGGTPASKKITKVNFLKLTAGLDALADDAYDGITLSGRNFGETVAIGQLVYLDDTAGEWKLADADAAGLFPARGIAVNGGNDGDAAVVMVMGVLRVDDWAFTEGATLYLSDTPGLVSGTAPSGSGDCIQVVGFALSDDEAFFNFTGVYAEHE